MRTAISNSYHMEAVPKERTPIHTSVNGKQVICHRCGPVRAMKVQTAHLATGEINLCSRCHSVIQAEPEQTKPGPQPTRFAWQCYTCDQRFGEYSHLPVGEFGGKLGRACPLCSRCGASRRRG